MLNRCFLLTVLAISSFAHAQTGAQANVPAPTTLEEANAQRDRAARMVKEADARFEEEQAACYQKFLVNSCLDEAKKRHTQARIAARKIDNPARDFQREARRADVEAKEAKRAADQPVREMDQKQQAEDYRTQEAAKANERQQRIDAKAEQAAQGQQKAAAEQAKRLEKQKKREKKEAERVAKKTRDDEREQARIEASVPK